MERAKNFSQKKKQNIVKLMDLTEFILDAHNTESCGNVLDLQRLRQDTPQWVEYVNGSFHPIVLFIYYLTVSYLTTSTLCTLLVGITMLTSKAIYPQVRSTNPNKACK